MVCLCIQSAKTLLRAKIAPNYQIEFGKLVACIAVSSISNLNLKAFRREHSSATEMKCSRFLPSFFEAILDLRPNFYGDCPPFQKL